MDTRMGKMVYHNRDKKGFTLAELMIVAVIVIILAGISVPIFANVMKNYQTKQADDQKIAAKAAAVAAYCAGYDSKGNTVDIKNESGYCTFLYDEANNSVYVLNQIASPSEFSSNGYANSIERYGLKIPNGTDYSDQVLLVTFDARYYGSNQPSLSKGTVEEPIVQVNWVKVNGGSLFK